MRPSEILPQHRETIRQLVREAGMANPRVFGSVLRGEDEDGSDAVRKGFHRVPMRIRVTMGSRRKYGYADCS